MRKEDGTTPTDQSISVLLAGWLQRGMISDSPQTLPEWIWQLRFNRLEQWLVSQPNTAGQIREGAQEGISDISEADTGQ